MTELSRVDIINAKKTAAYEVMIDTFKQIYEALNDKDYSSLTIFEVVLKAKADFFLINNDKLSDL
jgi:hypothetical protein